MRRRNTVSRVPVTFPTGSMFPDLDGCALSYEVEQTKSYTRGDELFRVRKQTRTRRTARAGIAAVSVVALSFACYELGSQSQARYHPHGAMGSHALLRLR